MKYSKPEIAYYPDYGWYVSKTSDGLGCVYLADREWRKSCTNGWHKTREEAENALNEQLNKENPKERVFCNHYFCTDCNLDWEGEWDCECDEKCASCNTTYTPYHSEDITGQI